MTTPTPVSRGEFGVIGAARIGAAEEARDSDHLVIPGTP